MVNDDLVKCPLCGGFTHIDKPELLTALHDQMCIRDSKERNLQHAREADSQ